MAVLTLTKTFVTLMSSGVSVSGQTARDRGEKYERPGDVRTYAGGRRRAITAVGELGTYTFTLLLIPRASVESLRTWQGQLVQVRDHKGRRFFGVYTSVTAAEIVSRATWNASIALTAVTADEGV